MKSDRYHITYPSGGLMEYQIALSPELGLSPADFVAAWNEDTQARDVAQARVEEGRKGAFIDPVLTGAAIAVLSGIATNVASSVLYDLIKHVLERKQVHEKTKVVEIRQPDGTRLIVITKEDE